MTNAGLTLNNQIYTKYNLCGFTVFCTELQLNQSLKTGQRKERINHQGRTNPNL